MGESGSECLVVSLIEGEIVLGTVLGTIQGLDREITGTHCRRILSMPLKAALLSDGTTECLFRWGPHREAGEQDRLSYTADGSVRINIKRKLQDIHLGQLPCPIHP